MTTVSPRGRPRPALEATSRGSGAPSRPFLLDNALPAGVTLLEASAGTGKTYAIAALAVRYLADGIPVDRLLVMTFTRSATGELRDRVRTRLVSAEAGLRVVLSGQPAPEDELVALLATGSPDQVAQRQRSLANALADFDAATIATIHGFCEQVLGGLGSAADCGRDLCFVVDDADLVDEVVDDLYLRKFLNSETPPPFSRREAHSIVAVAVANRGAQIEPVGASPGTPEALRSNLARRGRDEVVQRARRAGTIGYDDLLERLRETLTGPSSEVAVRRLRDRFDVVLVDEFQDTDPVQWEIFRVAFATSGSPLLLIGDPKQAVYSFRGADVWAYLRAAATADQRFTLDVNRRSDQPLIDAVDALLADTTLGHPDISYRRVTAAPHHLACGLVGAPSNTPLRLRLLHRGDGLAQTTPSGGWAQADSARAAVAADLADDIVALLSSPAALGGASDGPATVASGEVAVLVRANSEALIIHRALETVGVPSVIAGAGSVFSTTAAHDWLALLEALEQPAAITRARAAALTPFVGWVAKRLATAPDAELDTLQATLHRWAAVLSDQGVAALTETIAVEAGLVARELARAGGERRLTDLRHVGELLHAEALAAGAGARALTTWLRDRIDGAGTDATADERSRRLDSDADAVQIQTIHRSKGLEYPIVYLPYLWLAFPDKDPLPLYHDAAQDDRRTIDVGGERPDGFQPHRARAADERRGEDLRQAYVALTRARHQVVAWWATGRETKFSPLARLLLAPPGGAASSRPATIPKEGDDAVEARMRELADRVPGCISVERVAWPRRERWSASAVEETILDVRTFDRALDTVWRRASYTGITAAASHGTRSRAVVASEAEEPGVTDEAPVAPGEAGAEDGVNAAEPSLVSPMADLPVGAAFGIAVHAVCEGVDFAAADLGGALGERVAQVNGQRTMELAGGDPGVLVAALESVIATPLGPLAAGRRLRDVDQEDRLDEVGFELPLVGGDRSRGELAVADVASCIRRRLPGDDPLADYPDRLEDPTLSQALRGYLTGSIDLVARFPSEDGGRHVVVDYKTNWLAPPGEVLTTWHYRPAALRQVMMAAHYPLQAVLYAVALHRYLRWRMPGYAPARHLGGVLYLFVRGMAGPATPMVEATPCGVFAWSPPTEMIVELSDLLDVGIRGR